MSNIVNKTGFKQIAKCCLALLIISAFVSCSKTDPMDSYSRIPPDRNSQTDQEGEGDGMGGLFEKGYGTADKPYIIMSAVQIGNMSNGLVQGKMIYFQLGADIDMQGITDWEPLNSSSPNDRYIHFDGNHHVIKNFTCKNKDYASFFGVLAGVCKNVGFYNADVEASANSGAGVIGGYIGVKAPNTMEKTGQVENCYVSGTVKGRYAGGIASRMGRPYGGQICYIKNSYSTAEVTSTDNEAGGIVGSMFEQGEVSFCYSTGVVRGGNAAGGIAAIVEEGAKVTNCVAWNWKLTGPAARSGRVVGSLGLGETGFQADPLASDSYAWQNIVCIGFLPQNHVNPVSSGTYHGESIAVSTLQNTVAGWGPEWHSVGDISLGFPILAWQQERGDYATISGHDNEPEGDFANGTGTVSDPYIITKADHIQNMSKVLIDQQKVYFALGADIDMAGIEWEPLNNASGSHKWIDFDGRDHVIRNLTCHSTASSYYASFFGVLCGEVRNVGFVDADVSSTTTGIGIIAGYVGLASGASGNYTGRIINCYTTGTLKGSGAAGGIGGVLGGSFHGQESYVKNSYSFATVVDLLTNANGRAGGIVGRKAGGTGYIEHCYAAGEISTLGSGAAGGVFGRADGANTMTIKDCVAWNAAVSVNSGTNVGRVVGANANWLVSANNTYAYTGMVLTSAGATITASDQSSLPATAVPFHGVGRSGVELSAIVSGWDAALWSKTVNGYPVFSWHQ